MTTRPDRMALNRWWVPAPSPVQVAAVRLVCAAHARDADDLRSLLSVLGVAR